MNRIIFVLGLCFLLLSCATSGSFSSSPLTDISETYNDRGRAYLVNENYEKAIKDFTLAIEFDPNNADAYVGRGLTYQKMGNIEMAKKDFDKAASLDPQMRKILKPSVTPHQTDWWFVEEVSDGTRWYVGSITISKGITSCTFRIDEADPMQSPTFGKVSYKCSERQYRYAEFGEWNLVRDGSMTDKIFKKVCHTN
jgi:tetratricopeptide (TPR) repeat protein